jgi:hypothetical protein
VRPFFPQDTLNLCVTAAACTVCTLLYLGTASSSNDKVLCLDCDSRRAFGPTKTIRGVFWTQLNRLERLSSLSAIRERSF